MAAPTVTFKCGSCGKLMGVGEELRGRNVRCPHCQKVVQAPAAAPAPTPAVVASAPAPSAPPPPSSGSDLDDLAALQPAETDSIFVTGQSEQDGLFGGDSVPRIEMPPENDPNAQTMSEEPAGRPPSRLEEPTVQISPSATIDAGPPTFSEAPVGAADGKPMPAADATLLHVPQSTLPIPAETVVQPVAEEPAAAPPDEQPAPPSPSPHDPLAAPADEFSERLPRTPVRARGRMSMSVKLLIMVGSCAITAGVAAIFFWLQSIRLNREIENLQKEARTRYLRDHGLYENLTFEEGRKPSPEALRPQVPDLLLGNANIYGDLHVHPLKVTRGKVEYVYRKGDADPPAENDALILHLRLQNVSAAVKGRPYGLIFHPNDPTFNRDYDKELRVQPYTFLEIGKDRYYGPLRDPHEGLVKGQNFKELVPDEKMDTIVVALKSPNGDSVGTAIDGLKPDARLTWFVHLRHGRVQEKGGTRLVWGNIMLAVVFSSAEIGKD